MNGQIELVKVDLIGYTPDTQVYFVQNAGGKGTFKFLQNHAKFFVRSLYCGQIYHSLNAKRIAKFKAYCQSKGFEVIDNGKKV